MAIPIIRGDRETVAMGEDLPRALQQLEDVAERYGLSFKLICNYCLTRYQSPGDPMPYVIGDNSRTDTKYTLTCACKRRVYEVVQKH
jgi:hypothetical protein